MPWITQICNLHRTLTVVVKIGKVITPAPPVLASSVPKSSNTVPDEDVWMPCGVNCRSWLCSVGSKERPDICCGQQNTLSAESKDLVPPVSRGGPAHPNHSPGEEFVKIFWSIASC
mmetsp:Transcript_32717/g.64829  ORF Transcript_32717/g.64829 Transcript_32717/m.64829 type:complete len:116 (-) Transcript_32717:64-411(-)